MQLSVIIVHYKVRPFLEQCLASLYRAMQGIEVEVWVVDNNSQDGVVPWLQTQYPQVHILALPNNEGFSAANNRAMHLAGGEHILFLNPDTLVTEQCLQQCLHYMQQNPSVGALGVKMLDGSGSYLPESKRGLPTPFTGLYKTLGLHYIFPNSKNFARYYLGHLPSSQNQPVEVLSGAFMWVRKKLLLETGGFDERFFMYGEDIDLSFQLLQSGFQNHYLAEACIIHYKGESTRKGNLQYVKIFHRAMVQFVEKHYPRPEQVVFRGVMKLGILLRAAANLPRQWVHQKPALQATPQQITLIASSSDYYAKFQTIFSTVDYVPAKEFFDGTPTGAKSLVFVIDTELSLRQVVAYMEQHPGLAQYGIHYADTKHIIFSLGKNQAGLVLALN